MASLGGGECGEDDTRVRHTHPELFGGGRLRLPAQRVEQQHEQQHSQAQQHAVPVHGGRNGGRGSGNGSGSARLADRVGLATAVGGRGHAASACCAADQLSWPCHYPQVQASGRAELMLGLVNGV
eukprot:364801-Chlamydomonas_euryale.AAC.6